MGVLAGRSGECVGPGPRFQRRRAKSISVNLYGHRPGAEIFMWSRVHRHIAMPPSARIKPPRAAGRGWPSKTARLLP